MPSLISPADVPRGRAVRLALGVTLTLAAVVALVCATALRLGPLAPAADEATDRTSPDCLETLLAARGTGQRRAGGFAVEALSAEAEAFVLCRLGRAFPAERFPVLDLEISAFPPNYVLLLGWRRVGEPEAALARLQAPWFRPQAYWLAGHPAWNGRISELALYLYPQAPSGAALTLTEPILIEELRLGPDGLLPRLRALGTSWFAPDPWNHRSVHTLGTHADLLEAAHRTPVLILSWLVALAVFAALFTARSRPRLVALALATAVPFALVEQGHWLANLYWQREATAQVFGGLGPVERRYRQYDGELAALADRLKASIPQGARVFLRTGNELSRFRLAYFLRPRNVHVHLPSAQALRRGDFLVLLDDPAGLARARAGRFPQPSAPIPVTVLWDDDASAVLRVD